MASSVRTLADVLNGAPNAPALIVAEGGLRFTRASLAAEVHQATAALRALGVGRTGVVSLALANTADFVVLFLGAAVGRAIAAPLNPGYTEDEFKFYLGDASSSLLVVPESGCPPAEAAAAALGVPIARVSLHPSTGRVTLRPVGGGRPPAPSAGPPTPDDVALFLHTSGTTSRPKGVPLTHRNLAASVANIAATYDLGPRDATLVVMPLFHVHGLMAALLATLASGGVAVLPAGGKFSAGSFWRDAVAARITWYTAVPTIHQMLLARAATDYPTGAPPPLRFIRSCSAALVPAVHARLEAAFHAPVLEAYAMTEAAHQMTSNPLPSRGVRKAGSVGRGTGVEVAVLDESNKPVASGVVGEVAIRGANVTPGYLNNPSANAEAFAGGWFHTGDQGYLDSDGYVILTGRTKELINRGGEKIAPLEVDAALLGHPAVHEAVTFGVPSELYGEEVAAAVVLRPGAQADPAAILGHARTSLAAAKVPTRLYLATDVPRTATGKIQRRHVAAHFLKLEPAYTAPPTGPRARL